MLILFISIFFSCQKSLVVKEVIDGDTLKMSNGKVIRIIGIDAPELDVKSIKFKEDTERYHVDAEHERKSAIQARLELIRKVKGKKIKLIASEYLENKNEFLSYKRTGRYLMYVHLKGTDIGQFLLEEGYVRDWAQSPHFNMIHEKTEDYKVAEQLGKKEKKGIWE